MPPITDIADAIVTELNGAPAGTFGQAFTAARHYRPLFEVEDLKTLRVSVVPKAIEIDSAAVEDDQRIGTGCCACKPRRFRVGPYCHFH